MKSYMCLAPPWAQILPQPPPTAKYIVWDVICIDTQHALEVCGCCGGTDNKTRANPPPGSRGASQERRRTYAEHHHP